MLLKNKVNNQLQSQAEVIIKDSGYQTSDFLNKIYYYIVDTKHIPFFKEPNNDTLEAFHESENSNLEGYPDANSLFKSLF